MSEIYKIKSHINFIPNIDSYILFIYPPIVFPGMLENAHYRHNNILNKPKSTSVLHNFRMVTGFANCITGSEQNNNSHTHTQAKLQ